MTSASKFILVVNDEIDQGFHLIGPFETDDDAGRYGDANLTDPRWNVIHSNTPEASPEIIEP